MLLQTITCFWYCRLFTILNHEGLLNPILNGARA